MDLTTNHEDDHMGYKCRRCGRGFETVTEASDHIADEHPDVINHAVRQLIQEE